MTPELNRQIAYTRGQFEVHKAYVAYWQAMIISGAATTRNLTRGRKPTEEEKAAGQTIGWEALSDQEKIQEALQCMRRHIEYMKECNDLLSELMEKDT